MLATSPLSASPQSSLQAAKLSVLEYVQELIDFLEADFVPLVMEFEQKRAIELASNIKLQLTLSDLLNVVEIQLLERYLFELKEADLCLSSNGSKWVNAIRPVAQHFGRACQSYLGAIKATPKVEQIYRDPKHQLYHRDSNLT